MARAPDGGPSYLGLPVDHHDQVGSSPRTGPGSCSFLFAATRGPNLPHALNLSENSDSPQTSESAGHWGPPSPRANDHLPGRSPGLEPTTSNHQMGNNQKNSPQTTGSHQTFPKASPKVLVPIRSSLKFPKVLTGSHWTFPKVSEGSHWFPLEVPSSSPRFSQVPIRFSPKFLHVPIRL